jgi:hypothetical protein
MKKFLLVLAFSSAIGPAVFSQTHKNKCNIEIKGASPHVVMDKLLWYSVDFYNGSQKAVDALEWDAYFYDKFDEVIAVRKGSWSCGDWVKCLQSGETRTDREMPKGIGDADHVRIEVKRVHFVGGTSCD